MHSCVLNIEQTQHRAVKAADPVSAEQKLDSVIQRIDAGLGKYYAGQMGQKSSHYYSDDGIGLFHQYCLDSGFERDDVCNDLEGRK